jgi:hypothetical protein
MRYRPVNITVWSDRRFLSLSDNGKLLWLFFLSTPNTCSIPGVIIGGEAALAEQIGWSVEQYRMGYIELEARGLRIRSEGRVTYLSNALKHQKPAGPKAIKGMAKIWDDIPEGSLKDQIWEDLKIATKSWSGVFNKLFPKHHAMGYAQTSMEGLDTGSGSGSGSGTRSGSGSGSLSEASAKPTLRVVPSQAADPQEIRKGEIMRAIGPAHAMAFQRVKQAISSTAIGPSVVDRFEELAELLGSMASLQDAQERCLHVLAVREAEALKSQTMQFFGPGIWKRKNFEKALTLEVADVNGSRRAPGAAAERPDAFAISAEVFRELAAKETT